MEILLFQWSQVSKHPEWKSEVDAWFSMFNVSINLNIFYVNLDRLLKLLNFSFNKFFTSRENLNGRELMIMLR